MVVYIFAASAPHTYHRTSGLVVNVGNQTLDVLYVWTGALWRTVDTYKGIGAKIRRALNWPRTNHEWYLSYERTRTYQHPPALSSGQRLEVAVVVVAVRGVRPGTSVRRNRTVRRQGDRTGE